MKRLAVGFAMVGLLSCRPNEREPSVRETRPVKTLSVKPEVPKPAERRLAARREGSNRLSELGVDSWRSADACEFRNGPARGPRPMTDRVKIASWNVRWFPDSVVDPARAGSGTDIGWLSCALVDLDAPVIAVQEFRKHATARRKAGELIEALNRRTGGDWMLELDRCPDANQTHVGFLYDARRVTASAFRNVDELNPEGGCAGGLHPGFAGYFRFQGGLDLSLVSVHLMWGTRAESLELRRRARLGLRDSGMPVTENDDPDLLVLGDFNTNGCTDCSESMDPLAEVREAANDLSRSWPRLTLLENDIECTEYDGGVPLPLDHVVASSLTEEVPKNAVVKVSGICPELGCRRFERDSNEFHARLSDHCPIVVELTDRDWD